MSWTVQKDDKARQLSEEKLRKKLRGGDLTGLELCRPPDSTEWIPLHDTALFREEVPHTGDAAAAARKRALTGFAWHGGIFLAVMIFLGFPWWGIFWGLAVIGHAVEVRGAVLAVLRQRQAPALETPTAAEDAFEARLSALLAALPQDDPQLSALADAARRIHTQRLQLDSALEDSSAEALAAELEVASTEAERSSLQAHIEAVSEATVSRDRLIEQERALLRGLERMRLARLSSGAGEDLSVQLTELSQRLQAEEEVEQKLAAARQASRQRT